MNIEPKRLNYSSFNRDFCADLGESFDFEKMLINSYHNLYLRICPSFAAGLNQLSCPRVAAEFTCRFKPREINYKNKSN